MKTAVFALHGNPGSPRDWDDVFAKLDRSRFEPIAVDAFSDAWVHEVRAKQSKVILMGHSWGCYRLLKKLASLHDRVEKVILVNPTLEVEHPLSSAAALLLRIPVVGDTLIKSSHRKAFPDFVLKMIHPSPLESLPSALKSLERLRADWRLWSLAAANKLKQQGAPLTPSHSCPVPGTVFFGEKDQVVTPERQRRALAYFSGFQETTVAGEGHALLWTRPELIVQAITAKPAAHAQSGPKIGYHPGSMVENNVIAHMERHLREHPDRIALRWANRQALAEWNGDPRSRIQHDEIAYKDMAKRINVVAKGLLDIGIQKGDRVIIFLPMSLDMYVAMFAVQRIGAIAVFLDSWARSHHLGASAECVGPKAMISFQQAFALVDQVPEFKSMPLRIMYGPGLNCTHRFEDLLKGTSGAPTAPVESEFTALITFTTGSTGKPKGANRTHRFLSAQHNALNHVIPYTDKDADMPAFPIFSLNNLAAGVTTVLPALDLAAPNPRDPAILACQILNENITCTTLSPSMLVGLARYCAENHLKLTGLRRVVTGGAPISKDDVRQFYAIAPQTDLWILYGSTEAEPMAHIEGRDMLKESGNADPEIVENGVNVGHISEDVDYRFIRIIPGPVDIAKLPWDQIEVPTGAVGEFLVTGDHVCRDYYNNPEAFVSTKIQDSDGRVWHRTGDLAYLDSKKDLWIVGRVNNAVERGGKYFFPVQAEVLLKRLPFVSRCAFLGMPHEILGQANCAVIEAKGEVDRIAARAEIRRIFDKNGIPLDEIRFVSAVPMDPRHHSKVEYAVLRKQLLDNPGEGLA